MLNEGLFLSSAPAPVDASAARAHTATSERRLIAERPMGRSPHPPGGIVILSEPHRIIAKMLGPVLTSRVSSIVARPADVDTDLLVIPAFEGEQLADGVDGLDIATGGAVRRAIESREFQGKPYELFLTPASGWRAARVALVGAGKPQD